MFPEERRTQILNILNHQGRVMVADIAAKLNVSEVTVRQDLQILEKQGRLRRTHGGAITNPKTAQEQPFQIMATSFQDEKDRIAKAATELISPGDKIILDVGTTVTALAKRLVNIANLTVITNALNIASILEENPEITTIVTGGTLRAKQHSLVNPFAHLILERVHVDTAFIGISGIKSNFGLTNVNIPEAEIKSLFIKAAKRRIVLADSSKIGEISLAKVADISEIDLLITNKNAKAEEVQSLRNEGLEIKLV